MTNVTFNFLATSATISENPILGRNPATNYLHFTPENSKSFD